MASANAINIPDYDFDIEDMNEEVKQGSNANRYDNYQRFLASCDA
jgi:flagellar biosynthesis chaperone FliJ